MNILKSSRNRPKTGCKDQKIDGFWPGRMRLNVVLKVIKLVTWINIVDIVGILYVTYKNGSTKYFTIYYTRIIL
jgi:hypothetical protein